MTERFAIYYSPPWDDPLGRLGHSWLGRGPEAPDDRPAGLPMAPPDVIEAPARYGFHATLKAPFELADRATADDLLAFAAQVAKRSAPATIPNGLKVGVLGQFLALVPAGPADAVTALSGAMVRAFEPYRAPLGDGDIKRRRLANLTEQQAVYLYAWGYPYVFEAFRFHMTLSVELTEKDRTHWLAALDAAFQPALVRPFVVDRISVFHEPARDQPFQELAAFPLGG